MANNRIIKNDGIDVNGFWERIMMLFKKNGIKNQTAWCKENEISYHALKNAQQRLCLPVLSTIITLSRKLGTSVDFLVTGETIETTETDMYSTDALKIAQMYMNADSDTRNKVRSFLEVNESYQKKKVTVKIG